MAASSVNNVAAAFGSSSTPSPSVLPPVSWNPQSAISPALKTSFVGLYGDAGPKRFSLPPRRFPSAAFRARSAPRTSSLAVAASIAVGEKLPDASLSYFDKEGNLQTVEVAALTKGKKIVLFAVPGAFTPTCTQKHLPGFVEKSDEMKAKGVDTIACVSVNDAFVMRAWGESLGVGEKVLLLSDGNGHFTKALGVTLDLSDKPVGLGVRSKRYSLLAEDGVVKVLNLEDGGSFSISGAEDILKVLS